MGIFRPTKTYLHQDFLTMKYKSIFSLFIFLGSIFICVGQFDFKNQIKKHEFTEDIIDPVYGITIYEPLNLYLHSDSSRIEEGYSVNGWKEDHYKSGELLHKGYYIEGQLKVYKNYYPNGNLERNFKAIDSFKSKVFLYYPNGNIKSKVSYSNDFAMEWTDYHENGNISYYEKYNKDRVSHSSKISYYKDGKTKDELVLDNKKKKLYLYHEYFPNGNLKLKGHIKFNESSYDYGKYGTWHHYDEDGTNHKKNHY